ncbi:hypothetical protein [Ancylobacter terrae]|uniref:hypothetical protein n=1 Tax=Ancylobacter sp. sgz301288 TaxID=3342077 RepID=UPI00385EC3E5
MPPKIEITGSSFKDVGTVIKSAAPIDVRIDNSVFERIGKFVHIQSSDHSNVPPDLLQAFFRSVEQQRAKSQADVNPTHLDKAAEASGLKAWLIEHGVDLASFFVTVLQALSK